MLIVFGILTALSPFFGLPYEWLQWFLPVLGVLAALIAFTLRSRRVSRAAAPTTTYDQAPLT